MKHIYLFLIVALVACSKHDVILPLEEITLSRTKPENNRKLIVDDFGQELKKTPRKLTMALLAASMNAGKGKGWGKGGKPKPEDPPPPPPSNEAHVVLLDFDGHTITNPNSWWTNLTINGVRFNGVTAFSGMTEAEINITGESFVRALAMFNIKVTTDEAVFNEYPIENRTRVVFTTTDFYGPAGGVAWLNSREAGLDDPVYVFTQWVSFSGKYAGDAGVHEWGHALGLHHQADFINFIYVNEYSRGFTQNRAPNMGNAYGDIDGGEFFSSPMVNGNWNIWSRICDCHVDEIALLTSKLGLR